MNIKGYLDELQNKFGDFKVCCLYRDNGEDKGDKVWRNWSSVRDNDYYVARVKHRTILKPEIVLDLEQKDLFEPTIKQLDEQNFNYTAFSTGSKGYHIHLIFPELVDIDEFKVKQIKEKFITKYKADIQKAGTCMIALEFVEHWKGTGKKKELIIDKNGINPLSKLIEPPKIETPMERFLRELRGVV